MTVAAARWALASLCLIQIGACNRTPTSSGQSAEPPPPAPSQGAAAAALPAPVTRTLSAGPWKLSWSLTRGVATRADQPQVVLYDHIAGERDCIDGLAEQRRENPEWSTELEASYVGTERVVAVLGAFVTTAIDYGGYCGGAHPFQRRSFDTVDLATGGKPVTLEAVFGSAARAAIARNPGLGRALGDEMAVVEQPWTTHHFAVKAIDDASVVVRLGLPHATEVSAGTLGLFDIRVPIPAQLRSKLLQSKKAGTLLGVLAPELAALEEGVYRDDRRVQ